MSMFIAMKSTLLKRGTSVLSAALSVAAVTFVLLGLLLLYYKNAAYEAPYKTINPQAHFATQMDKRTFVIGREFQITRDVDLRIVRELTRMDEGILTRAELPQSQVFYRKGDYKTQRIMEIPSLPPGAYILQNHVCWRANPLREDCMALPLLTLDIYPPLE